MKNLLTILFTFFAFIALSQQSIELSTPRYSKTYQEDRYGALRIVTNVDTMDALGGAHTRTYTLPTSKYFLSAHSGMLAVEVDTLAGDGGAFAGVIYVDVSPSPDQDIWFAADSLVITAAGTDFRSAIFFDVTGIRMRLREVIADGYALMQHWIDIKRVKNLPSIVVDDIEGF